MSIAELKTRMQDVPGIQSLTMTMAAGKQVYNLNGREIQFESSDSDATVEQGIRAAIAAPALAQIASGAPVTPEVTANAAAALHPALAATLPAAAPAPAPATPAAPRAIDAAHTVKDMMAEHTKLLADIHAAQVQLLGAALARQRASVATAVGKVASKVDAQTEDFLTILGQFQNDLGVE